MDGWLEKTSWMKRIAQHSIEKNRVVIFYASMLQRKLVYK